MRRLVALEGNRPVYWSFKDMPDYALMDLIRPALGNAPTDDELRALARGETDSLRARAR
jgi:hypothetical protein